MLRILGIRTIRCAAMRTPVRSLPVAYQFKASLQTYSGGQPYDGQGGFYGSIKTRSEKNAEFQPGSRAEATDLDMLVRLMERWDEEKTGLRTQAEEDASWKALAGDKTNAELISRLVVKGAPVWGLSVEQREFVTRARQVSNA